MAKIKICVCGSSENSKSYLEDEVDVVSRSKMGITGASLSLSLFVSLCLYIYNIYNLMRGYKYTY